MTPIGPYIRRHLVEAECFYEGPTTTHYLDDAFDYGLHAERVFDEHLEQCASCQAELAKNVAEQEVLS